MPNCGQALQHGLHRLAREGRIVQLVARAAKAHNQAITDQDVGSDAFDIGKVLHPRKRMRVDGCQAHREGGNKAEGSTNHNGHVRTVFFGRISPCQFRADKEANFIDGLLWNPSGRNPPLGKACRGIASAGRAGGGALDQLRAPGVGKGRRCRHGALYAWVQSLVEAGVKRLSHRRPIAGRNAG